MSVNHSPAKMADFFAQEYVLKLIILTCLHECEEFAPHKLCLLIVSLS
jgi:hypothetical protein